MSKEIGKAWRKSLAREPHTPVAMACEAREKIDCSRVLEYAKIRTVLQFTSISKVERHVSDRCCLH